MPGGRGLAPTQGRSAPPGVPRQAGERPRDPGGLRARAW